MSESEQASKIQSDLSVHQLNLFRTVARHLSYTKAAEILYLSQPAVSQQIKALEQALGLRLFERKGRGIVLTRAGEVLLVHAERLLSQLAQTAPVVEEIRALKRGSVVIGASTSAGTYVVPALLGAFHAHNPHLHVTLTVVNRHTIEEYLLAHRIDLAVISFVEQQERFTLEFLQPYELVIVAPHGLPLAAPVVRRASAGWASLACRHRATTFLAPEAGVSTHVKISLSGRFPFICMAHLPTIKKVAGIAPVFVVSSTNTETA